MLMTNKKTIYYLEKLLTSIMWNSFFIVFTIALVENNEQIVSRTISIQRLSGCSCKNYCLTMVFRSGPYPFIVSRFHLAGSFEEII
jgi:hypothetical protein